MAHNFGKLNSIFFQNVSDLIKTSKGKKLIKEYINTIKDSKELMKQYSIFEYIENQNYTENIKDYINECISQSSSLNKKKLKEETLKLNNLLENNSIKEKYTVKNENLYNNIDALIHHKNSVKTINEKVDTVNLIVDFIKNKEPLKKKEKSILITNESLSSVVDNFNDKYLNEMTEEDKETFTTITSKSDSELKDMFTENKNECLILTNKFLKEDIDVDTKDRLLNVKERLLEYNYSKDNIIDDIINIINLKKTLKQDEE